jgi:ABC-type multidrug transport system fused ATPase/permease subunit
MVLGIEVSRLQARFDGLVGVLVGLGTAAVVVAGVRRVSTGALTAGDLVVFASYASRANTPMRRMAREATRVARTMTRAERIAEILSADDMLVERPGAYSGARATGAVELDHVSFSYEPDRPALRDVSFRLDRGERVAVIGPSGAGKSTVGALMARFYDPSSGRVLIDGRDARDCSLLWLRQQIGVLLQDTVLLTGTVRENIAYASAAGDAAVVAAARAAAAHDFIRSLPAGYSTELGPQGVGLSGGQRQRVGIARTLLRDPPLLILDEPTTALDVESELQVVQGLTRLMRGRTTLIITHSLALAHQADRVIVLDGGRIVADGPPSVVVDEGALLARKR